MAIEMPRGLPFSVDTWTPQSMQKRHHFITHAHKDHCFSISTHHSFPIYSSFLTRSLLLRYYPNLDDGLFVGIEVGQTIHVVDPDGDFTVTAFDAHHCPGALMFLFEGSFGNILHTGDCRLTPECLQNLPRKYIARNGKVPDCQLDFIFLDCTFGKSLMKIPNKQSAIQQVINCIWKHPDTPLVYLTCDFLGQEEILVHVFQTFGSKIYVDRDNHRDFYHVLQLIAPQIISNDPSSRFHLFDGFPKLYEKARRKILEARESMQPEPLIIRPSAQWYACEETELTVMERKILEKSNMPIKDQYGIWHVCYSMHSSRQELEWALQLLSPKWVVSTTPECRAMELEYVKKQCFSTLASSDDRFWKLLDIDVESFPRTIALAESSLCSPLTVTDEPTFEESELPLPKKVVNKEPTLPLFGRARLGYRSCILPKEMEDGLVKDSSRYVVDNEAVQESLTLTSDYKDEKENQAEKQTDSITNVNAAKIRSDKLPDAVVFNSVSNCLTRSSNAAANKSPGATVCTSVSYSSTWSLNAAANKLPDATFCSSVSYSLSRSSKGFNDNMRKLYRSMNAPVPQPLPSLVQLMKANKRAKRRV